MLLKILSVEKQRSAAVYDIVFDLLLQQPRKRALSAIAHQSSFHTSQNHQLPYCERSIVGAVRVRRTLHARSCDERPVDGRYQHGARAWLEHYSYQQHRKSSPGYVKLVRDAMLQLVKLDLLSDWLH
jgi:hypothetical protein